jgi:hypothetical protein
MTEQHDSHPKSERRRLLKPLYALLLAPVVCALWTASYNSTEPSLIGIPFFYWYQLLWVALSAILTGAVYLADR